MDRRPWPPWTPRPILVEMIEPDRRRPGTRSRADDPLMREVRWRLFSREELPARLRRLQRLEDVAYPPPAQNGSAPEQDEDDR